MRPDESGLDKCLDGVLPRFGPATENRNPKTEIRKKSENRRSAGDRASFAFRLSAFGFSSILLAVVLVLAGCAGYQLGPTNGLAAGDKTIQITPFLNHTLEPRLGDAVTTALRQRIQRDGTYRLATHGGADIVVTGVLTRYDRHVVNLEAQDVLTVKDYRVNVIARITVHDLSTGSTTNWMSNGYTLVRVGSDLTSSERQAMPLLAEDLAKNVTDSLVDGSW